MKSKQPASPAPPSAEVVPEDELTNADYLEMAKVRLEERDRMIRNVEKDYTRYCAAPDTPLYLELREDAYSLLEDMRIDRQKLVDGIKVLTKAIELDKLRATVEAMDERSGTRSPFRRFHQRKSQT